MPLYSRYRVGMTGEKAHLEKELECILDFTPREIINLAKAGKTVLIGGAAGQIIVFDEKERKIIPQTPLARLARGAGNTGETLRAAAKSADERIFALAPGGKNSIELMAGDNFGPLAAIAYSPAVAGEITALRFNASNDLYITAVDRAQKNTALYICRAGASYSKIEKITSFPLEADSQAENASLSRFVFYNRGSGSVFGIDTVSAQSGLVFNEIPQSATGPNSGSNASTPVMKGVLGTSPPVDFFTAGHAAQLADCGPYFALVRSDRRKVRIFDPVSGAATLEIAIAGLAGNETASSEDGVKYAIISSANDGALWLLNRETLALTGAGKLEGMDSPAVLRVSAR